MPTKSRKPAPRNASSVNTSPEYYFRLNQDLRDLTRYRAELRQSQNRVANRIQKFLEQANLKLRSVPSNALGVSGRRMLGAIIAGQDDAEQLAKLARGKLKNKIPELEQALEGRVRDHHRFLLAEFLEEWEALGERIRRIETEIDKQIRPFEPAVALWQTIPGIERGRLAVWWLRSAWT